MASSAHRRIVNAAAVIGAIVLLLGVVFYVFPPQEVASNSPDKAGHDSMAQLPVALWWLGSLILAASIIYAVFNNRYRSPNDKSLTENATRRLYETEDRAAKEQKLG